MTLTIGTGPFGDQGEKTFNFEVHAPGDHVLYFEDSPRRVRAMLGGETVADSRRAKLMHETGHLPIYYFPEEDVRMDLLEATDHTTHCPFKGDASYWSVRVGENVAENAVWGYPEPIDSAPPLAGYVAFYFRKMDAWFEEDEQIFVHPRDPYHRVDVLESSRHVRVSVNGEDVSPEGSLRDRTAAALLHPARGRPRRRSRPERQTDAMSLQGDRLLPLTRGRRRDRRRHRLALPRADSRRRWDQRPPQLLQREGGPGSRRRTPGTAADAVVLGRFSNEATGFSTKRPVAWVGLFRIPLRRLSSSTTPEILQHAGTFGRWTRSMWALFGNRR
jgi:uncharacterized protein (DUF427 family)